MGRGKRYDRDELKAIARVMVAHPGRETYGKQFWIDKWNNNELPIELELRLLNGAKFAKVIKDHRVQIDDLIAEIEAELDDGVEVLPVQDDPVEDVPENGPDPAEEGNFLKI